MNFPKVTVLMPIYKNREYLSTAIESIINQTFKDFEFLIVSEYGTNGEIIDVVNSYRDKRITLVQNKYKMGLPKSLNRGIDLARGKYIARMDDDDISYPNRLEKQVKFMDENPHIGVCGTWVRLIGKVLGSGDVEYVEKKPEHHDDIKLELLLKPSLTHSTLILRRSCLEKYGLRYDDDCVASEDYELWHRAIQYLQFANIKEVLLDHRIYMGSTSGINKEISVGIYKKIMANQIKKLGINPTEQEIDLHYRAGMLGHSKLRGSISDVVDWFNKIIVANSKTLVYDQKKLEVFLTKTWFDPFRKCQTVQHLKMFLMQSVKDPKSFVRCFKYFITCIVFHAVSELRKQSK